MASRRIRLGGWSKTGVATARLPLTRHYVIGRRPVKGFHTTLLERRLVLLAVLICGWLLGCGGGDDGEYSTADATETQGGSITVPDLSDVARQGADLFTASCSECHGPTAGGTSQGPPLVDKIYEPGHHADFSFVRAVQLGSPQHHWQFGDMEPVPGLSPEDVNKIICYVRELQYANGIFSDPGGLVVCQA